MTGENEMLSLQQAADETGYRKITLIKAVKAQQLKAVLIGRQYVVTRKELNQWMATRPTTKRGRPRKSD